MNIVVYVQICTALNVDIRRQLQLRYFVQVLCSIVNWCTW